MKQPRRLSVEYYETEIGYAPALEWLRDTIDNGARVKLVDRMKKLEIGGPLVWQDYPDHFESLGGGLFQIRLYHRDIWYRLIYFYEENKAIVCHGFIKKSNKTPRQERQVALDRMKDYQKRFKKKDRKDAKKKKDGQRKKRK